MSRNRKWTALFLLLMTVFVLRGAFLPVQAEEVDPVPSEEIGESEPSEDPGSEDPGTGETGGEDTEGDPGTGEDPGTEDPDPGESSTDPGTEDPGSEDPGSDDPGSEDPGTGETGEDDPWEDPDPGTGEGTGDETGDDTWQEPEDTAGEGEESTDDGSEDSDGYVWTGGSTNGSTGRTTASRAPQEILGGQGLPTPTPGTSSGEPENEGSRYVTFARLNLRSNSMAVTLFYSGTACAVVGTVGLLALLVVLIRSRLHSNQRDRLYEEIVVAENEAKAQPQPPARAWYAASHMRDETAARTGSVELHRSRQPRATVLREALAEQQEPEEQRPEPSPRAVMPRQISLYTEEFDLNEDPEKNDRDPS